MGGGDATGNASATGIIALMRQYPLKSCCQCKHIIATSACNFAHSGIVLPKAASNFAHGNAYTCSVTVSRQCSMLAREAQADH